ncbi:hypothetical protein Dsin_030599 [Dipteronia sinensis]|uniref:Neprosin PEP catalytic domain-containing protein n=1 Tax=Dipteronia sinensis TaxID=43782 RepID=A0AAD9ZKC8_9ROSI|nr:hypothetical protein Dsin_030599 [Dipteronia sinensis]
MVMGLSKEQFFEVEKELQVGLNKSSGYVKTIQLEGGDIVDCIEIDKQPSLNHPLLKNHKIQKVEVGTSEGWGYSHGATGVVSVYDLSLTDEQISSANILLTNGPPEQRNVIMAGWMVAPSIYGDSKPRLFTYWTDTNSHNWVLTVFDDDIVVGYWPKELFPHLLHGTGYVGFGGLAKEGKDRTSPPMGSGHKPDGYYNRATYFKHIRSYTDDLQEVRLSYELSQEIADDTGCYGLQNDRKENPLVRDHFLFGGPGGKCGA